MKNHDSSKITSDHQPLSLNLGEPDCHFINVTQIIDNIDFLYFRLTAKEKWIQITRQYCRKLNIDTLKQVVIFEKTYNQYRLYQTSKIFFKWKALLNWRKITKAVKLHIRDDLINQALAKDPLRAWYKLAAKIKLITKQNNVCRALIARKNRDILLYFYDIWIRKTNNSIDKRERAVDNWEIFSKQLLTNYNSEIKQLFFSRSKYERKWKMLSRSLQFNYKFSIMQNEAHHILYQKKLRSLIKTYIFNIKRSKLLFEWRHLFIRNQWRHLALREVTIGILKDVAAAKKRLTMEQKLKEMAHSLIEKRRNDGFKDSLNQYLEDKKKAETRKWMRKWSARAQAKAFAWKFIKSHLKGILRDYSNHIQNEAALKIQRAFRRFIHRRETRRLLLTRAFIGWTNITRRLTKKAFVFPDFNVVIYSKVNFEISSFPINLPELDFNIFRDCIEFKYSENNMLADDVGYEAGSLIDLTMPFVKTNLDPFKRLKKAVVPQYRTRYNPKLKLDFNFVKQNIENLAQINKPHQIPINDKFVQKSLPKPRISNRRNVDLKSTILPLHVISFTRLEEDIRCRTFDENDILPSNLLPPFNVNIKEEVAPLLHLKFHQEYIIPKSDEKKFNYSFDSVIQRVIGHSFIPRFDILRMEVSSLFDRNDLGFDKGAFSIAFDKAVVEPAENTVIKGLSLLNTFAEPGLALKYPYTRKTVRFVLPKWTDGSPIAIRVQNIKLDKPFKTGIEKIVERSLPSIIERAMDFDFLVSGYNMIIPGNFPQYIGGVAIRESLRRLLPDMFFPFVEPIDDINTSHSEISDGPDINHSHSVITTTITSRPGNSIPAAGNVTGSDPGVVTISQDSPSAAEDIEIPSSFNSSPSSSSHSSPRVVRKRKSESPHKVYRPPSSDEEDKEPVVEYPMVLDLLDLQLSAMTIVSVNEFTAREFDHLNFGWIDEEQIKEADNIFTFNDEEEEEEENSMITIGSFISDLNICPSSVDSTIGEIHIPDQDMAPKPPPVPTITASDSFHDIPTIPTFSSVKDLPKPVQIPEFPNPLMPPFTMPVVQPEIELPSIDEPKRKIPIILRIQNIDQVDIEPQKKISRPPSPRPPAPVTHVNQNSLISDKFTNAEPIDIPPEVNNDEEMEDDENRESPEPNAIASSSPKTSDHHADAQPTYNLPPAPAFPPVIGSPKTTTTSSSHIAGSQQPAKTPSFLPPPPHLSQSDDDSYEDASPDTPTTIPSGVVNLRPPPPPVGSDSTGTISDEYVTMNLDDVIYEIDDSLFLSYKKAVSNIVLGRFAGLFNSLEKVDLFANVSTAAPVAKTVPKEAPQKPRQDPIDFNRAVLRSLKQPLMQLIGDIVAASLPDIQTAPPVDQQSMTEILPDEAESVSASAISSSPQSTSTIESIDIGSIDDASAPAPPNRHGKQSPKKTTKQKQPIDEGIISIDDSPIELPDRFIRADEGEDEGEGDDYQPSVYNGGQHNRHGIVMDSEENLELEMDLGNSRPVGANPTPVIPSSEELTLSTDEFDRPANRQPQPKIGGRKPKEADNDSLPEIASDEISLSFGFGGGVGRPLHRGERANSKNKSKRANDEIIQSPSKRAPALPLDDANTARRKDKAANKRASPSKKSVRFAAKNIPPVLQESTSSTPHISSLSDPLAFS